MKQKLERKLVSLYYLPRTVPNSVTPRILDVIL